MNAETIAIAQAAVRLYAESHPRPAQVTQKQAAEMMDSSTATICRLVRKGLLRLNSAGQIPISEVDRVLALP